MHQLCSVSQRRAGEIPSEGAPPELVADDAVVEHGEEEGARALGAPHAVVPPPPHQLAVKLPHLRRRAASQLAATEQRACAQPIGSRQEG